MKSSGCLILVVGPSGAGKDTVLAGARSVLGREPQFVFPRREITRVTEVGGEDHIPVSGADFAAALNGGVYALSWQAHGFAYGIPKTIEHDLDAGRTVVVNASRGVTRAAKECYPTTQIVVVTAPAETLADRLAQRGRECANEIRDRLARQDFEPPRGPKVWHLSNTGSVATAVDRFVAILREIDAQARD